MPCTYIRRSKREQARSRPDWHDGDTMGDSQLGCDLSTFPSHHLACCTGSLLPAGVELVNWTQFSRVGRMMSANTAVAESSVWRGSTRPGKIRGTRTRRFSILLVLPPAVGFFCALCFALFGGLQRPPNASASSMRAASTRYGKRKVYVAGILVLSGVFLYRGMCSLNDAASGEREPEGPAIIAGASASLSCEWEEGGPQLFVIRHNENHPDGECGRAGDA